MKKDRPVASIVEKLTVRPTEIGLHIIERLERKGADKSAWLRQLLELGFACQQAGFILDGSVLRHAGSVWHVQPQLSPARDARGPLAGPIQAPSQGAAQQAGIPEAPGVVTSEAVVASPSPSVHAEVEGDPASATGGLSARLRSLSG